MNKENFIICFMVALFVGFMGQVTLGSAFSGNYFFLIFPLVYLLKDQSVKLLSGDLKTAFYIFSLLFFIAWLFQYSYWHLSLRKLVSFILFMSMFSYALININERMVTAFKIAIVVYTFYLSLSNLNELRSYDLATLGFAAKNQVGNQRYGFLYIIGFWLVFFFHSNSILLRLSKIPLLIIIFLGILLTFSRASIVGLIGSGLVFLIIIFGSKIKITAKNLGVFSLYGLGIGIVVAFSGIYEYIALPFEYFADKLFTLRSSDGSANFNLVNATSSSGYRIFLIKSIIEYVASSPLFGSGYLGIWIILDDGIGSAHGQFNDVLFRTGIVGLFIYLYILQKLGSYLYKVDLGLFLGFIGVLVFGLFHETFKVSHGAFVLAFLIGMWATHLRNRSL
ncbi:MAG: O-antigen ligase family protein [SAR86 cluster bacterium]|nr:O-antigen ligase family protein [SAR86 cluster bacterium]